MFHKACVAISEDSVIKKSWKCPECTNKQRKGDNSCTPVKGISDTLVLPSLLAASEALSVASPPLQPKSQPSPVVIGDPDVKAMRLELAEYMAEEREFRKELRAAMASMGDRINGLEKRLEALETMEVAAASVPSAEVKDLQNTVVQLRSELNDRDQDALLSDLDIGQLPEEKGENVLHVVTLLAVKLGVTLDDRDVVFAERVGAIEASGSSGGGAGREGSRPRRIVVRLARRHIRDELLQAARVRRNFTTTDIGLLGPPRRIYVNERLTRSNRQLFYRVREECRKRQWRYCWTKRGRLYTRQADGKPVFPIRSEMDFSRVFGVDAV